MSARLIYRWAVFLIAGFYAQRMAIFGEYDGFGGPFRYLTIWGLYLAFANSILMLRFETGRSNARWDGFAGSAAVINAMVVFLYWRLFLADPTSVTRDGVPGPWWLEYYLHGVGPLLLWIDVLFVHRGFLALGRSALWLVGIVAGFVAWSELVVAPLNIEPAGTVTSGLPYRFLNNMEVADRAVYYAMNVGVAMVFLLGFAALAWAVRRLIPTP